MSYVSESSIANGTENKYLYNGKELQDELGLNWLDYGRRYYDFQTLRFTGIDPIAEDYYHVTPYNYAENSPIANIDLWGLQAYSVIHNELGQPEHYINSDRLQMPLPPNAHIIGSVGEPMDDPTGEFIVDQIPVVGDAKAVIEVGIDAYNGQYASMGEFVGELVVGLVIGKALHKLYKKYKKVNNVKLPYTNSRPSYKNGQVEEVWKNGIQKDGNVYDPNTGDLLNWDKTIKRNGQWDMGHKPGKEYRKLQKDYLNGKITKEEFLKKYQNSNNYQPELPKNNRGRKFEQE